MRTLAMLLAVMLLFFTQLAVMMSNGHPMVVFVCLFPLIAALMIIGASRSL
jgi:hypothetical protein